MGEHFVTLIVSGSASHLAPFSGTWSKPVLPRWLTPIFFELFGLFLMSSVLAVFSRSTFSIYYILNNKTSLVQSNCPTQGFVRDNAVFLMRTLYQFSYYNSCPGRFCERIVLHKKRRKSFVYLPTSFINGLPTKLAGPLFISLPI